MNISVGANDPTSEKCYIEVRLDEDVDGYGATVKVGVWVANVDSRSEAYAEARRVALEKLRLAVASMEADA